MYAERTEYVAVQPEEGACSLDDGIAVSGVLNAGSYWYPGGLDLDLIPAELTYGLERLAMFLQGKRTAFDIEWAPGVTWGDVYRENERQWSRYNFEEAPVDTHPRALRSRQSPRRCR